MIFSQLQLQQQDSVINSEKLFAAAAKSGIGVKYSTGVVLEENTVTGEIFDSSIALLKIVEGRHIFRFKRDVEVIVEIRVVGGYPREMSVHAFADGFYFVDGCACHSDIVVFKMHKDAFEMVDFQRASNTLLFLARPHHEMLYEERLRPLKSCARVIFPEGPSKT